MNKFILSNLLSFFLLLYSFSIYAYSIEANEYVNGKMHLKVCGFKTGEKFQVNYYVNKKFVESGRFDSQAGCFEKFVNADPGDHILIAILNYEGVGQHKNLSFTVPGSSRPGDDNNEPEKNKFARSKITDEARNQARMTANWVVENYGALENFRRSYAYGLVEGVRLEYNWNRPESWLGNNEFYYTGQKSGMTDGLQQGIKFGKKLGEKDGSSEAIARFKKSINSELPVDTTILSVPTPKITKPSIGQKKPNSLKARINSQQQRMNYVTRTSSEFGYLTNLYFYDSSILIYDLFMGHNYQYNLTQSWYRKDWAFELWKSGEMERRRGKNYSQYRRNYKEFTDPYKTEDANNNAYIYEQAFEDEYERVIDAKWMSKVSDGASAEALNGYYIGLDDGKQVADDHYRQVNFYQGYLNAYYVNFDQGALSEYSHAFKESFNETVYDMHNSVVIDSNFSVKLLNSLKSDDFAPGTSLTLIVSRLTNIGGGTDKNLSVTIAPIKHKPITIDVDFANSTSKEAYTFNDFGEIPQNYNLGPHEFMVTIDHQEVPARINITYESVIREAAKVTNNQGAINIIKMSLKKEWVTKEDDTSESRDSYLTKNKIFVPQYVTLLETLDTMKESEAATVAKALLQDLESIIGKKERGGFFKRLTGTFKIRNANRDIIKKSLDDYLN